MNRVLHTSLFLAALVASASAQRVTMHFVGESGSGTGTAFALSADGGFACGTDLNDGFVWSAATGLTLVGPLAQPFGVTDDGAVVAGVFQNGAAGDEAGVWSPGVGLTFLGRTTFPSGCGPDVSWIEALSWDGSVAGGHVWDGCRNVPARWEPGTGWTLLATTHPSGSARVTAVSGDGQVLGGWDRSLPDGPAPEERASLWLDASTQVFPATSPTNPAGFGTVDDLNEDGTAACGRTGSRAFRWTASGGLELLPDVGTGEGSYAKGISADGSVVVGIHDSGPQLEAVLWLPDLGAVRLVDHLASFGVVVDPSWLRRIEDVSADGTVFSGGGTNGPWVIRIEPTWVDLGGGAAGVAGVPRFTADGELTAGSVVTLALEDAAPSALMAGWLALGDTAPIAVLGGTLHANPKVLQILRFSDGAGAWDESLVWPAGVPAGTEFTVQMLVQDGSVPDGITMSNAVAAVSP